MAERKGLEPSASGVTGRRYNRLNYRSKYGVGKISRIVLKKSALGVLADEAGGVGADGVEVTEQHDVPLGVGGVDRPRVSRVLRRGRQA